MKILNTSTEKESFFFFRLPVVESFTVIFKSTRLNKPISKISLKTLCQERTHFSKYKGTKGRLCILALCIPPPRRLICTRTHTRTHYRLLALWLCEHTWPRGNRLRPAPYFRQTKQPIDSNGFKLLMTWAKNEEPLNLLKETVNVRRPTADLSPDRNHSHLW